MSRTCKIIYIGATGPQATPSFVLSEPVVQCGTAKNAAGTVELCLIKNPPQNPFFSNLPETKPKPDKLYVVVKTYDQGTCVVAHQTATTYPVTLRQREAQNFQTFFPNLLRVYGADDLSNPRFIISEYCEFGSLRELRHCQFPEVLEPLTARFAFCRTVGYQALMGLVYLHEVLRIMHRDINPKNLLVDNSGRVKIGDFLSSSAQQPQRTTTDARGGSVPFDDPTNGANVSEDMRGFRAPELPTYPHDEGHNPFVTSYDYKVDVYSLALTLLELLDGYRVDHDGKDASRTAIPRLEDLHTRVDVDPSMTAEEKNGSKAFLKLLRRMVDSNASQRPSALQAAADDSFHPSHFPGTFFEFRNESVHSHRRDRFSNELSKLEEDKEMEGELYCKGYQAKIDFLKNWKNDDAHVRLLYDHEYPYIWVLRQLTSQLGPYRPAPADSQYGHYRFGSYLSDVAPASPSGDQE